MHGWMDACLDGCMAGWMNAWLDGRMHSKISVHKNVLNENILQVHYLIKSLHKLQTVS